MTHIQIIALIGLILTVAMLYWAGYPWRGFVDVVSGDFLAPTYPKQEKKPVLKGKRAPSGGTWQESLAKYDPDLRSWRTRQLSLTEDLEQCSVTWPSWGFLLDGECWDRTTLAPPHQNPLLDRGRLHAMAPAAGAEPSRR